MLVYKIDRDRKVTAFDDAREPWQDPDVHWSALPLDDHHDIYHDDSGLLAPGAVVARIGRHRRVPLPAYVVGADGEAQADAKLPIDYVETLIG